MGRPLALAATAAVGVAILAVGIASIGKPIDMPYSAAMIGALGVLWGATSIGTTAISKRQRQPKN